MPLEIEGRRRQTGENLAYFHKMKGLFSITITVAPKPALSLTVRAYKVKTAKYADLTWSGATTTNVDVFRNGIKVVTTLNDGAYTDAPGKTATTATYKIGEAGTTTCSNEVTVSW